MKQVFAKSCSSFPKLAVTHPQWRQSKLRYIKNAHVANWILLQFIPTKFLLQASCFYWAGVPAHLLPSRLLQGVSNDRAQHDSHCMSNCFTHTCTRSRATFLHRNKCTFANVHTQLCYIVDQRSLRSSNLGFNNRSIIRPYSPCKWSYTAKRALVGTVSHTYDTFLTKFLDISSMHLFPFCYVYVFWHLIWSILSPTTLKGHNYILNALFAPLIIQPLHIL